MANSNATFDLTARAVYPNHYGAVKKASVVLSKAKNCPKEFGYPQIHGYLCDRLNAKHKGDIDKLINAKSIPVAILKALRAYQALKAVDAKASTVLAS
jgi:hypothetical protein